MATSADTAFRALGLSLINSYGTSSVYVHKAGGTYDPNTTSMTGATTTTATPKVFIGSPSKADLRAGVLAEEKTCLLAGAAVDFYPKPTDTITVDGETYKVRPVTAIYSGDQVALWILGLRK